jgi:hypothetical protein
LEDFGDIIFRDLCWSLSLLDDDLFCGRRRLTVSINSKLTYLYYNYYEGIPAAAASRLPRMRDLSSKSSSLVSSFEAYLFAIEFVGLLKP